MRVALSKLAVGWTVQTIAAFSVALALAACDKKELFETPQRATPKDQTQLPGTLSTLTIVTGLSYESIRALIQTQAPTQQTFSGNGQVACAQIPYVKPGGIESHEKCADVPYCDISLTRQVCGTRRECVPLPDTVRLPSIGTTQQCANYTWKAVANREGEVVVGRSGDSVHMDMPIQIGGNVGLNGDLAKVLSLSGKSFEAKLKPGVNVSLALGPDWCPILNVAPTNNWVTSATVEAVGRNCIGFNFAALGHPEVCASPVNIDLANKANEAVVALQGNLTNAAKSAINCKSIQDTVAAQWRPIAIQLAPDTDSGRPLYLNISPKGFAFSGLRAGDDSVKVALKVWAETKIDPTPVNTDPTPVPQVSPLDAAESRLSVSLPARIPYSDIATALKAKLGGKEFTAESSGARGRVRIDDIDIYPTSKGLAVGIKIDAKLPGRILDTKGWVYLFGRPKPILEGSAVEIADLGYATVVDNEAWKLLVGIFDSQIMQALQANSKIDLKPAITKSAEKFATQINSGMKPAV